jgi:ubiquinone/menaquinone biosynthesis C-methylase UbiE
MEEENLLKMASQLRKPEGEEGIKTGVSMNQGNRFMNLQAIRILNPSPGDSILEIGMGNGMFVKDILEHDEMIRYTGFDHSALMVEEAKRINADAMAKGKADFLVGDVSTLPFPGRSFNKILTVNTIYFWKDNRAVLKELKRVLKPSGALIISLRPRRQMQHYPFTKYGFNMYANADLKELLIANGFGVKKIHENTEPDYEYNGNILKMSNVVAECYAL